MSDKPAPTALETKVTSGNYDDEFELAQAKQAAYEAKRRKWNAALGAPVGSDPEPPQLNARFNLHCRAVQIAIDQGLITPERFATKSNIELLNMPKLGVGVLKYIRKTWGGEPYVKQDPGRPRFVRLLSDAELTGEIKRRGWKPLEPAPIVPLETQYGPHSLGRHEALHMASVLTDMVERELVDHPAIQLRPDWQAIANAARIKLDELYQAIGKEA